MLIGIMCFLFWYMPVSYHNVYTCDDYWFGTNVNNNGFWGNQIYYWLNWEGSYTHTFLDSIPHVFDYDRMPFLFNICSMLLLVYGVYYAIRSFFKTTTKLDAIIFASYITTILYTFTNGDSEIRFWVSANSYVIELAVVIIALSLYYNKEIISSKKFGICMTILLFIISGSKLTFILYMIIGIIIQDVILKKKITRLTYFTMIVLGVFSMLNILAPGNLIRLNEEVSVYHEYVFSFFEILQIRMLKIIPFIGYSMLLIPVSICFTDTTKVILSNIFYVVLFGIIAFIIDSLIMYICFQDPGPLRVYILSEMFILMTSIFVYLCIAKYVKNKLWIKNISCTIATIILIICNIPMINKIQPSIEYATQSRLRNQKITNVKNNDCVDIVPLPNSYLLLSYFANDIVWIEDVYVPYFNKKCDVILKQSDE